MTATVECYRYLVLSFEIISVIHHVVIILGTLSCVIVRNYSLEIRVLLRNFETMCHPFGLFHISRPNQIKTTPQI